MTNERIDKLMSKLTKEEQLAVQEILMDYSKDGSLTKLNDLYEKDFYEIPVSIDTFIESPEYAGWFTENGENVFPYWREKLREIFDESKGLYEIVLGGSIGCGKTTIAVIALAYSLYWLMCLKDPNPYFGLGRGDTIYIVFFNATLTLSKGVGYKKFQSLLQHSPWFMARGKVSGDKYLDYVPNKTDNASIEFTVGSQPEHALGKAIICLDGKTRIYTEKGTRCLESLAGSSVRVLTKYDDGSIRYTDKPVEIVQTAYVTELYEIELENGYILRCTPEHKFRLKSGEYVEAQNLTEGMDIDDGDCTKSGIYSVTNLINGKRYIGKSESNVLYRLNMHKNHHKSNRHLQDAINKYGIDNFRFEILEFCEPKLCADRERFYIEKFDSFKNGYNSTTGGEGESGWHLEPEAIEKTAKVHRGKVLSEHTKQLLSQSHKGKQISQDLKNHFSQMYIGEGNPFYGKHHTQETKKKIAEFHKRSNLSKSAIQNLSKKTSDRNKNRFWVNNGKDHKFVTADQYDNLDQSIWKRGRFLNNSSKLGKIFIHLGVTNKQIPKDQLDMYLALGWERGMYKKSGWRKNRESKKSN